MPWGEKKLPFLNSFLFTRYRDGSDSGPDVGLEDRSTSRNRFEDIGARGYRERTRGIRPGSDRGIDAVPTPTDTPRVQWPFNNGTDPHACFRGRSETVPCYAISLPGAKNILPPRESPCHIHCITEQKKIVDILNI